MIPQVRRGRTGWNPLGRTFGNTVASEQKEQTQEQEVMRGFVLVFGGFLDVTYQQLDSRLRLRILEMNRKRE